MNVASYTRSTYDGSGTKQNDLIFFLLLKSTIW